MLVSNQRPLPCKCEACSSADVRICVLSACVSRVRELVVAPVRGCSRRLSSKLLSEREPDLRISSVEA